MTSGRGFLGGQNGEGLQASRGHGQRSGSVAWLGGSELQTGLWLVGEMDRGAPCAVWPEPRPLLGQGAHASGTCLPSHSSPLRPGLRLLLASPRGVHASSCSKRRKRRATGKQPSLTVVWSPVPPPDPVLRLPALGTADASHGQAVLTGPLSASSQLRVHI